MMCFKLLFMTVLLLLFSVTLNMALLDKHATKCKLCWFWKSDNCTVVVDRSSLCLRIVSKWSLFYLASYLLVACFAFKE